MAVIGPNDPYDSFKKYSEIWEKLINDFIQLWTNNQEFAGMSPVGTEANSRYLEAFRKNQEALAGILNIPTKSDLTNVASLTLQTEEKIETLEEQILKLQDSIQIQNKEIETVVEVAKEIIKLTKQLKTELVKTNKELVYTKDLQSELQEMKSELNKLSHFKEEFDMIKELLKKDTPAEPLIAGVDSSK
ncbi:polyhydroxyalkanoate biosynthesis repressor PhaR [Neobacillus vireti]|uniref:polyhydroxyalkanoate biosynthesis repressor PhaR n=1 Tax=Neobacillus vireti TaxID=220686 RepID=UPI002FFD9A4D